MRINPFVAALVIVVLLCQCKAGKQKAVETKTIAFSYGEMYCGGAAPPAELVDDMARLRPMADREVEVYTTDPAYSTPKKYKTNSSGQLILPVNIANEVFINVYPSADGFKAVSDEYECYKKFITANLIKVDMKSPEKQILFSFILQCNPCIPAAP